MIVTIPMKLPSVANIREHWSERSRRARVHRNAAKMHLMNAANRGAVYPALPVVVTLTRIAPRALDDDNLASACKAARDGVADWLGVDDRDPRVVWRYAQEKGAPKQTALRIKVAAAGVEVA